MKNCPVCNKKLLKEGLKNHIINSAESESYSSMKELFTFHKHDFKKVSRIILLRKMQHFQFVMKNTKESKKKELIIPN